MSVKIDIKQISLFPIIVNNSSSILYKKIYTKHLLYFFCLLELNNNLLKIKFSKNFLNFKKIKKKTQILRSPNRHKIAQFHIAKKSYMINSSIYLTSRNRINSFISLTKLIVSSFLNFESSMIFVKNIKISTNLTVNLKNII